MPKHKWTFKSRFRSSAYSWKGTQLASKRMKGAVSEIKKVAKTDSALEAVKGLLTGSFYDPIKPIDIIQAHNALITAASKTNNEEMVKQELSKMILKCPWLKNKDLCDVIMSKVK